MSSRVLRINVPLTISNESTILRHIPFPEAAPGVATYPPFLFTVTSFIELLLALKSPNPEIVCTALPRNVNFAPLSHDENALCVVDAREKFPNTLRTEAEANASFDVAEPNDNDPHSAEAELTVTVIPELIVTSLNDVGTVAEPAVPSDVAAQIDPFQLPVTTANRAPIDDGDITNEYPLISVNRAESMVPVSLSFVQNRRRCVDESVIN